MPEHSNVSRPLCSSFNRDSRGINDMSYCLHRNQIAVMEAFPRPIGIVTSVHGSNSVNVQITGEISAPNNKLTLRPGQVFYSNTLGEVLSGNVYYGQSGSYSEAIPFIDLSENSDVILSLDSAVAIALTDEKLLLGKP